MAKRIILEKISFVNGLPVREAWDIGVTPAVPFPIEGIPTVAKPCDCCCDGDDSGGGGGSVNIDTLPAYNTWEDAMNDAGLLSKALWRSSSTNTMGVPKDVVFQKP